MTEKFWLVDSHVHFYDYYNYEKLFDKIYSNFQSLIPLSQSHKFIPLLFVCDTAKSAVCSDLYRDLKTSKEIRMGNWRLLPAEEEFVFFAQKERNKKIFCVTGRQVISSENLEVLAVGCLKAPEDHSRSLAQLVAMFNEGDCIPIIPWSLGKWWGKRGKVLSDYIADEESGAYFLGDNQIRTRFLPYPSQFKHAEKLGIKILPGSDNLPVSNSENQIGNYCFSIEKALSQNSLLADLKKYIHNSEFIVSPYGKQATFSEFLIRQTKLRACKQI